MIKDTLTLEKVQRQATKFILNDYESDYKTRLLKLDLLPLMYILDFYDILFLSKLSNSHHHISTLITTLHSVMLTLHLPLPTNFTMYTPMHNNCFHNFYFNRLPRLSSIETTIYNYLWNHFKQNFLSTNPCTFHFCCRCTNCYNQGLINNFSKS